jgi:uncharacterized phage-associated protein
MTTVHDVAAALLRQLGGMTAMKLEKLVYYCQAWHLARYRRPIFADEIEAWADGPVVRSLFEQHRRVRAVSDWPLGDSSALTDQQRATVSWVATKYGAFSAERLSRMTHIEAPWLLARGGLREGERSTEPISHDVMASYYARQRADADSAVASAVASAALEGVELDSEWQERLRAVVTGEANADDVIAAEISRARGE